MTHIITTAEVIERDKAVVMPAIYRYTDLVFARGESVFLHDYEGRRYYDMAAGIATMNVGHCHPQVAQACVSHGQPSRPSSRAGHGRGWSDEVAWQHVSRE